jgi:V8-like Glu-specific endopeptidase
MPYLKQAALDRIKQATCQIVYGDESGTGYLISNNRIVTCWHVVKDVPPDHPVARP